MGTPLVAGRPTWPLANNMNRWRWLQYILRARCVNEPTAALGKRVRVGQHPTTGARSSAVVTDFLRDGMTTDDRRRAAYWPASEAQLLKAKESASAELSLHPAHARAGTKP